MVAKSLPKWSPNPPPRHRKLELSQNCKSNENHCIYYVLNTSRHRILVPCPLPNHKKTTIESALQFSGPYYEKVVKMSPKLVPRGSQNPSKIFQIQVWSPRCPVWCPWGPQDHQNAAPGYPNASPGYQNDKLFNKGRRHEASAREIYIKFAKL